MKIGFNDRFYWECQHTRAICYYSVIANMELKDRVPIDIFWPLPSDPNYRQNSKQIDEESQAEIFKRLRANESLIKNREGPPPSAFKKLKTAEDWLIAKQIDTNAG
jgi:hypothetical protein